MAENMQEKTPRDEGPQTNAAHTSAEKTEQANQQREGTQDSSAKKSDGPPGGYDNTPIPRRPTYIVGYTLKITFHRAENLAIGDAHAFSSDPYVLAQLNTDLPTRHKEDPNLRFRTPTVRKSTDPEWNEEWVVTNVPSSGFKLKLRVYDEDPADHDDMLGKVHVTIPSIDDQWAGFKDQMYQLTIRDSSKRALIVRALANCFQKNYHIRGDIYISIENLGRTTEDDQNGRIYTAGPCRWIRHYSPILGRIANIKEPDNDGQAQEAAQTNGEPQKKIERYNFQANQIQFAGPVPAELYHRFVEFKPWVKRMFTTSGVQGIVLGKALHHQHSRVYSFGRSTEWGHFPQGACKEMTQKFLDLVHYDKGGRIFTYVLTLDALLRFTETGKEFGIDMLSKHTMHSDVSIYIAFSGEFFIRRLKRTKRNQTLRPSSTETDARRSSSNPNEPIHTEDLAGPKPEDDEQPPIDPSNYELVIDNDSGTYRPNAKMLPILAKFLSQSLPGLHVQTLDCQADEERMNKLKSEQRERKKKEGENIVFTQASDSSSVSSSDEEELDEIQHAYQADGSSPVVANHLSTEPKKAGSNLTGAVPGSEAGEKSGSGGGSGNKKGKNKERSTLSTVAKDVKLRQEGKMEKLARTYGRRNREDAGNPGAILEKDEGGQA